MKTDREMEIRILEALEKNEELERRVLENLAGKRGQNAEAQGEGQRHAIEHSETVRPIGR